VPQPGFVSDLPLAPPPRPVPRVLALERSDLVIPQACPWYDWPLCAIRISACAALCSATGIGWLPCMAQCLFLVGAAPCVRCIT
jgi:hypothetical protein